MTFRIYLKNPHDPLVYFPAPRKKYRHPLSVDTNGGMIMVIDKIALVLAIIGALNWGGIGLFGFDTVAFLCGGQVALLSRIIYALVGLAGLWCITLLFRTGEETGHAPHTA